MQATISAPTTKILYKLMEKYNLDSEALFNKAGILKQDLSNIDKRISYGVFHGLWEQATLLIDDPCFGLKGVDVWHPSDLSALGYAWMTSATLRDALERFQRYIRVLTEFYEIDLLETDKGYELVFNFQDNEALNMAQADASMAIVIEMCRIDLEQKITPVIVFLTHPEPQCKEAYTSYFGCTVQFDQPINKIILPIDIIDVALFNSDPNLALINDHAIAQYLNKLNDHDIISKVKKIITQHLTFGITNEQVAYKLNLSERTLNRRLKEQGYTFKDILKDVRVNLSKLYIQKNQFNVTEIAFQLGFSDSSSFSRAFKRWTGASPLEYKKEIIFASSEIM